MQSMSIPDGMQLWGRWFFSPYFTEDSTSTFYWEVSLLFSPVGLHKSPEDENKVALKCNCCSSSGLLCRHTLLPLFLAVGSSCSLGASTAVRRDWEKEHSSHQVPAGQEGDSPSEEGAECPELPRELFEKKISTVDQCKHSPWVPAQKAIQWATVTGMCNLVTLTSIGSWCTFSLSPPPFSDAGIPFFHKIQFMLLHSLLRHFSKAYLFSSAFHSWQKSLYLAAGITCIYYAALLILLFIFIFSFPLPLPTHCMYCSLGGNPKARELAIFPYYTVPGATLIRNNSNNDNNGSAMEKLTTSWGYKNWLKGTWKEQWSDWELLGRGKAWWRRLRLLSTFCMELVNFLVTSVFF